MPRSPLACVCACLLAGLAVVAPAHAVVSDATVIDGPSADLVGLDSVAMAPDGSGGAVYRKRIAGRVHIFAARFSAGAWQAPQQVDVGQAFDSSWPVIGAGNGGRLVVVWVQAFGANVQDRMFSASLDPGATLFQAPIPIDLNVGDGTDIWPSIAMNAGGQALLAYRVITGRNLEALGVPGGFVDADLRVARYDGAFWSSIGGQIARNLGAPVDAPTPSNGPQVGIGTDANGVVAWQEPDDDVVDRIWARRLFSNGSVGFVQQASPNTFAGKPLLAGADEFALDMRGFGTAAIAYRQQPGKGGPWTRPRVLLNQLPSAFTDTAAGFEGARVIDGAGADGPTATVGPLSVAIDTQGAFDAGISLDHQALDVGGDEDSVASPDRLDESDSAIAADLVLDRGDDGALAAAWKVELGGADGVTLLERRADGTPIVQPVSSPSGGDVGALRLGGSGLGDAAIAFLQGTGATTTVMGANIDAPPSTFSVDSPVSWTRKANVPLDWDPAVNAFSGVTYSVDVDDEEVATGLTHTAFVLKRKLIRDGKHAISVVATDAAGQPTTGQVSELQVDRTAPRATVTVTRRTLKLKVSDGAKGETSGAVSSATLVAFGDGKRAKGARATSHHYARPGRYRVTVTMRDTAGNTASVRRLVVIR